MTQEQINDRYVWHVRDCTACCDALCNMRLGRLVTSYALAVALSMMVACSVTGAAMAPASALASTRLWRSAAPAAVMSTMLGMVLRLQSLGVRVKKSKENWVLQRHTLTGMKDETIFQATPPGQKI